MSGHIEVVFCIIKGGTPDKHGVLLVMSAGTHCKHGVQLVVLLPGLCFNVSRLSQLVVLLSGVWFYVGSGFEPTQWLCLSTKWMCAM